MDCYTKYLQVIIDKHYYELKPIIENIRKIGRCPNCGGIYLNSNCMYCCSINKELKQNINNLEIIIKRLLYCLSNLPLKKVSINKLFNLLYSLKDDKISCINYILEKYNYINTYNRFIKHILSRLPILNNQLTDLEINSLETLIFRNEDNESLNDVYNFFIYNALLEMQNVSYECFVKVIKQFTENLMKSYYPNPKCIIKSSFDFEVAGSSFLDTIKILEKDIKELYYNGNPSIIFTIFHELIHSKQWKEIFETRNYISNPYAIKELKDFLLVSASDNYKNENYCYLSYEHEANYIGLQMYKEYLEKLGFKINEENYNEELNKLRIKIDDNKRYINGEERTLDEIFNYFIMYRAYILDKYPQIRYLYKVKNGLVVPKSEFLNETFPKI